MASEKTLVLIKPDGVKRSLIGPVLTKLQESQLNLIAVQMRRVSLELAKQHYAPHEGKGFFSQLLDYITGKLHGAPYDKVMALVYEGENAIKTIRALGGNTNPEKADPNTIRGMFGRITTEGVFENVIHASATPIEAEREIKLWFRPEEIINEVYPSKKNDKGQLMWERIPDVSELPA